MTMRKARTCWLRRWARTGYKTRVAHDAPPSAVPAAYAGVRRQRSVDGRLITRPAAGERSIRLSLARPPLSAETLPPCRSTRFFTISPRPNPRCAPLIA
jgi:hypothetical protein